MLLEPDEPPALMLQRSFGKVVRMCPGQPSDGHSGDGDRTLTPDRVGPAWRTWLEALASDAEAALGAALAYETLDARGRTAILDAIEQDAPRLGVPRVALFAPLLSVERDAVRRERIRRAMGNDVGNEASVRPYALAGSGAQGTRVCVVIRPVYLDFVRVTVCRFAVGSGIDWVRDDPLLHARDAPQAGSAVDGMPLEPTPLRPVVDEIAAAIVAHRRRHGALPDTFKPLLDLFDAALAAPDDDASV